MSEPEKGKPEPGGRGPYVGYLSFSLISDLIRLVLLGRIMSRVT